MKTLEGILKKQYDKKIEKTIYFKDRIEAMQKTLQQYDIACVPKDEWAFYQLEIIYESILNKQKFEDTFLSTYVAMHDFWESLDYRERKHQMSVDIDAMRKDLKSFLFEGEIVYMPMFDLRMNRLYTYETVLLELKQYHRFMKHFDDVIQYHLYGLLPYVHHFTSCEVLYGEEERFVLYDAHINRFYLIENNRCTHKLCLCPDQRQQEDIEELRIIAKAFAKQKDEACAASLLKSTLISDKAKKHIEKYLKKMKKKE